MRWMILLILGLMFLPVVFGQGVPQDVDSTTLQTITQEHKNTRKFLSDELTRQRNDFFKTMEEQTNEYEDKADDIINNAVWKLGLMWGGIVLFVFGMSNFLGRKLDKRKWNKMLESARSEIMADMNQKKAQIDTTHQQKEEKIVKATQTLSQKESALESKREALNKARPQLVAMQTKIVEQQKQLQKVIGDLQLFEDGDK